MGVVGLAVVTEVARELEQLLVTADEHAAFAGGDRLRGVERIDASVAPRARPLPVPSRAVGVGAIFDQKNSFGLAERGDPFNVEGDVATDVNQHHGLWLVLGDLRLEVIERHAEVLAVAVDEDDLGAGADRRVWRRHEGVRRAEHGLAADVGELQRRERRSGPARKGDRSDRMKIAPGLLEGRRKVALRPALRVNYAIPKLVQAGTVALIETDRKLAVVGHLDLLIYISGFVACRIASSRPSVRRCPIAWYPGFVTISRNFARLG